MRSKEWYLNYEQTFWAKADIGSENECWIFKFNPTKTYRYPTVTYKGKSINANRMAWMLHNKTDIPEGMMICHTCDNPKCVNPRHLFLGTASDNMRDMVKKGRNRDVSGFKNPMFGIRGSSHPSSVLTEDQVMKIRSDHAARIHDQVQLAKIYGVTQGLISAIVHGRTWRHLPFKIHDRRNGSGNPHAKLSEELIARIRERVSAGELQQDIAADIGVHRATIGRVVGGKIWKHLKHV